MDFSKWWVGWLAFFVVIEGLALFNDKKGDTLSEHVWRWFKVKDKRSLNRRLRMGGLVVFMAWLSVHFISGGTV